MGMDAGATKSKRIIWSMVVIERLSMAVVVAIGMLTFSWGFQLKLKTSSSLSIILRFMVTRSFAVISNVKVAVCHIALPVNTSASESNPYLLISTRSFAVRSSKKPAVCVITGPLKTSSSASMLYLVMLTRPPPI